MIDPSGLRDGRRKGSLAEEGRHGTTRKTSARTLSLAPDDPKVPRDDRFVAGHRPPSPSNTLAPLLGWRHGSRRALWAVHGLCLLKWPNTRDYVYTFCFYETQYRRKRSHTYVYTHPINTRTHISTEITASCRSQSYAGLPILLQSQ